MVVCKFYLQGTCRFGENCKFEHQISDFNAAVSTSILRQAQPQREPLQHPQQSATDLSVAVRAVINDGLSAEKGGQWLLSCYAPFKGKPAFPGFEDMSFEEVRYGFYSAQRNGTVQQYKQQLQAIFHEAILRMKALQTPSPDIVNLIKDIFNSPVNEGVASSVNTFSFADAGKNILGQQTSAQSIFGQKPQGGSIFAQANQALFGANQAQQQQNVSPFGNTTPNIFNRIQQQPTSPMFEATTTELPSNSIFASQQQSTQFFAPQQEQKPIFTSPLNQQQQQQPAQSQMSMFSLQQQPTTPSSSSIFGGSSSSSAQTTINLSRPDNTDQGAYSKREDLSEGEARAFEADSFDFGHIPEKPPTLQMCF